MEAATARLKGRSAKQRSGYGRSERRLAAAMLAPSLIVIALVAAYPIGYAIWLSLNEYSVRVPGLVALRRLRQLLRGARARPSSGRRSRTTFLFTGISVTLELVIGLGMASGMHEAFKGRASCAPSVLVPWAILTVVTAITWRTIFEPELGLAPGAARQVRPARRRRRLARPGGLRAGGDDLR